MLGILIKAVILVMIAILIRATLPRYRVDQLITQHWKYYLFYLITYYLFLALIIIWLYF